ncbi:hypothetical protein BDV25DRAFT_143374 [Aspergillus avenaceus]|uniref:Uncharacterized protein n=1 Tax=Aspergillus avenaceus TaxID=36643 RepID=A0A5N6TK69_ASPAV|nr:hypothetical protein BDV25DRAFT_143374 [Aspergillus avenaceus]
MKPTIIPAFLAFLCLTSVRATPVNPADPASQDPRKLPPMMGHNKNFGKYIDTGRCLLGTGRDHKNKCVLKGREDGKAYYYSCSRESPCKKNGDPCSISYSPPRGGPLQLIVNCNPLNR